MSVTIHIVCLVQMKLIEETHISAEVRVVEEA